MADHGHSSCGLAALAVETVATIDQCGPGGWQLGALYGRLTNRYLATEGTGLRTRAEAV